MAYQVAPLVKSLLGRHRVLSPSASVRVSPICLGGMSFGEAWKSIMGECNKETVNSILDYFFDQGGNFIDTAGNYQDEESEIWIGEWMQSRKNRDQIVLATKFSTNYRVHLGYDGRVNSNYGGNSTKSLHVAAEDSLKKLQTSYIDVLYVHWYDHVTSVQELMLGLNSLLNRGKVLYLGASDMPAWFVAKCNQYARDHGLRGFVVYQEQWSAAARSFERDILSLCEADGMGITPWGALGSGQFKKTEEDEEHGRKVIIPITNAAAVSVVLEKIAREKGTKVTSVALAYVLHKAPYVFPICGGRKLEHLKDNIDALGLELDAEEIKEIESAAPFDIGFPLSLIGKGAEGKGSSYCWSMNMRGHFDYVEKAKPIVPSKMKDHRAQIPGR
ncbi:norsolorinic acid reductase [Lepidopterella palustris CBS 459.81]|uniref:Norsolorinic acid reductase n=1 Tax=Lepidopterella palustris CBS 459.81 TaxID=1314670 RepID=A0A8E2E7F9_9PEZI|nr:norsolorinic acid reductase [Lepidopterella palustris CBS 459.81]